MPDYTDAARAYVRQYNNRQNSNQGGGGLSENQRDAWAYLTEVLKRYGLDGLGDWAKEQVKKGSSSSQVLIDLYQHPTFKQRFPAIAERQAKGLAPITPEEYIEYEKTTRQLMQAAGMPPGFYDRPDDFTRLIAADLSPAELDQRIKDGYQRVAQADLSVREAFKQYFGVNGDSALAAYFMDPTTAAPILEEQARMAELAGVGHSMLGGWLDKDRMQDLAKAGFDADKARSGFQRLAESSALFTETVGEGEANDLNVDEHGLAAVFGIDQRTARDREAMAGQPALQQGGPLADPTIAGDGSSGAAADAIERRRQGRVAAFSGGGGAVDDKSGITGLA